jgi:hypothetical protein
LDRFRPTGNARGNQPGKKVWAQPKTPQIPADYQGNSFQGRSDPRHGYNHKEAIMQEFPFVANHLYLLAEVVDGLPNDIPDPYASEEPPEVITREIITMIDRGYNQIVDLAWEKYRGNSSR